MTSAPTLFDFAAARSAMVDSQLRPQGIADPVVLAAFQSVPREDYVDPSASAVAYGDRGVPSTGGATMMPPASLALLVQALEPSAGERALIVGHGDPYAAAILAAIGVDTNAGDGTVDLILFDGAVEHVPEVVSDRLKEGGRIAVPLRSDGVTRLTVGRKVGGTLGFASIGDAYVPALPGFERPQAFVF